MILLAFYDLSDHFYIDSFDWFMLWHCDRPEPPLFFYIIHGIVFGVKLFLPQAKTAGGSTAPAVVVPLREPLNKIGCGARVFLPHLSV